jgi:hypothetical protein
MQGPAKLASELGSPSVVVRSCRRSGSNTNTRLPREPACAGGQACAVRMIGFFKSPSRAKQNRVRTHLRFDRSMALRPNAATYELHAPDRLPPAPLVSWSGL